MTPNSQGYQPGMGGPEMMGRMGPGPFESNKDPFGGMRKGEGQLNRKLACYEISFRAETKNIVSLCVLKLESSS